MPTLKHGGFVLFMDTKRFNMKISEFKKAKRIFERLIMDNISHTVDSFYANTGYSPHRIRIDLMDITQMDDENKRFIVNNVWVEIDI